MPGLFRSLRGQIDRRRRNGFRTGQFLERSGEHGLASGLPAHLSGTGHPCPWTAHSGNDPAAVLDHACTCARRPVECCRPCRRARCFGPNRRPAISICSSISCWCGACSLGTRMSANVSSSRLRFMSGTAGLFMPLWASMPPKGSLGTQWSGAVGRVSALRPFLQQPQPAPSPSFTAPPPVPNSTWRYACRR